MKSVLVVVAVAFLTLESAAASAEVVNRIVATVDGNPITLYELQTYRQQTIQAQPSAANASGGEILEGLITEKIIAREAEDKGIIVRDEDVDRYVDQVKERNHIDDDKLAEALKAQGLTIESYRAQVKREVQRQQLINREIRGKVNVTPEEIDRYHKAHADELGDAAGYEVAHIVFALPDNASKEQTIAVQAKADAVYQQLRDGGDFAELAKKYSEDAGTAPEGGVLGWFKKGELVDSLEKEADKLKVGEFSRPVHGPKGLHIVKVTNRRNDPNQLSPEATEEIKQKLYAEALDARFRDWLQKDLRQRHHVEILE